MREQVVLNLPKSEFYNSSIIYIFKIKENQVQSLVLAAVESLRLCVAGRQVLSPSSSMDPLSQQQYQLSW